MGEISDQQLMSFADGELSSTERAEVEAYLAADPSAPARLAVFTETGKSLADIYRQPMLEPVPQRLIDSVTGQTAAASAVVLPFRRRQTSAPHALPQWAVAASAALAISAFGLYALRGPSGPVPGDSAGIASTELAAVLETAASGTSVATTVGNAPVLIKPVFTFATAKQGFCRQYRLNGAASDSIIGVACRLGDGRWHLEGQFAFSAPSSETGKITTAGDESPAAADALVDKLISGDVLDLADEASLMQRAWTSPSP